MAWQALGSREDVQLEPGRVRVFEVGERRVAICNVAGELHAIDDVCTHDGGSLDQGQLDGTEIECPRHGARFDVRDGRVTRLPAFAPVESFPVRLSNGVVEVDVED